MVRVNLDGTDLAEANWYCLRLLTLETRMKF